jgi:4-hydroxy-3-polyprenylbenzoate decarboxylase
MLDVDARRSARKPDTGPPLDFQSHLAQLDARGLLLRIDRPINKDNESHRWERGQFQGRQKEDERRASLFTNVIDSFGPSIRHSCGSWSARRLPQIYAVGVGRPVEEIEAAWVRAITNPIPPILVTAPPCQAVVITGESCAVPARAWRACRCRFRRRVSTPRPI